MENYPLLKKPINEILLRITSFKNPFNIIGILPEEDEVIVKKKYKKLSLKIHPDRCSHPLASDAIAFLSKAMKSLENEEERKKYTSIIEQARKDIITQLKAKGTLLETNFQSEEYHEMVIKQSEAIIEDMNERLEKAEKIRQANLQREREELQEKEAFELQQKQQEEQWEKTRQQRVNNWKSFMKKQQRGNNENSYDSHKPIKPPKTTMFH